MWNSPFYSMVLQGFRVQYLPLKGVSKQKNHHLLTFVQIKTVSGVMRSCYLFLQVPMVMKKCLQTYHGIEIALENFFTEPKVISSHSQNSNFLHHFEPFWLPKWFESV